MKVECPHCRKTFKISKGKHDSGRKFAACSATTIKRRQPSGLALKNGILRAVADLPAMPNVVGKAQEIISKPDSNVRDLVSIIEKEQSISARILKLANSTYYGLSGKVATVQHASVLLGYKTLGEVIAVAGISNLMENKLPGYKIEAADFWKHSLAVAVGSRLIAAKKNAELVNDAFFAGLLHDAGKLVLDRYVHERREDFELLMQNGQTTFPIAEKEILGFDHSEIASAFCLKWKIPSNQSEGIKFHHYPLLSDSNELAYIIHAADFIAMQSSISAGIDSSRYQLEQGTLEFLGLPDEDVDGIRKEVVKSVEEMTAEIS